MQCILGNGRPKRRNNAVFSNFPAVGGRSKKLTRVGRTDKGYFPINISRYLSIKHSLSYNDNFIVCPVENTNTFTIFNGFCKRLDQF